MGLLDVFKGFPFSFNGDYTNFYENSDILTEDHQNLPQTPTLKPHVDRHISDLQKYRTLLQRYNEKLKLREASISERERISNEELQLKEAQILERERTSLEKLKAAADTAHEYSKALLGTEYRVIDYAKRFDTKENALFYEIQKDCEKFEKHNSTPSQNGFVFENEFSRILSANGFQNVLVTRKSGDYGADITAEKDSVKYVVQCKYYTSMVGIDAVQQVCGAKIHYGAHVAVVATNSVFTHPAKILAEEAGVFLWDCEKIESMKKAT
ncbi:restriction endonuclease [uncultured Oscillibacter sp.]|uniref:restriction endonuclease n=1 Tax=uncultured Oscillibacter sp. TaxID=876091 RepID=UPI0025E746A6|nr:restriction endonuclease [uncultured Oscillibacter sp.]